MKTVYVYDSHCGWDDLIYLKDKEISDIDRFCPVCEEWDQLIGIANNKAELIEILNMHNIGTKKIFEELLEKFDEIQSIDYGSEIVKKEELKVGLFFFVKVSSMNPYYASQEDERNGGHCHHTIVDVACVVNSLRNELEAEQ